MEYTKNKAIAVVTSCAKSYQENLANRTLLFLCLDKHNRSSCIEFTFNASNFLHLTGLKPQIIATKNGNKRKITAKEFYRKCLDGKLSERDFELASDGTTDLKLKVLPLVVKKDLSAKMIGDYNSYNPKLYTEKLAGNVKVCIGFISDTATKKYIPNTVLNVDIQDYVTNMVRVAAAFRKKIMKNNIQKLHINQKNIEWDKIKYPEKFSYLSSFMKNS